MHVYGRIQGTLSAPAGISGTLSAPKGIGGTLTVPAALLPPSFEGPYEVTPTEYTQTLETKELYMDDDITVNPIPDPYIVPTGTLEISQNGEADVTDYAAVDVDVQPALQNKSVTVSSSGDTEITADDGYYGLSSATATVPTGSASQGTLFGFIESGTKWRVRGYNDVNTAGWFDTGRSQGSDTKFNAVPSGTTVTPTESSQTVGGSDYMMQGAVTVNAIPSDYVGSAVPRDDSSDLTASGATVTAPAGYYSADASKTIASGSATTPATSITANPTINVNSSTGVITATASATKSITPTVSAGYVSSGTAGTVTVSGSNTSNLSTQAGTTISPSESQQTAVASGKYTTGAVIVDAIPSDYVGSAIDRRSSSDLSASGATVTAPAGYYSAAATKSVASGTAGTPTASKGTVSNHSVTVTPSVTNTAGYISGGTKTGTGVSVLASELVSGTKSITSNGTGIDVKDYAAVDVNVSGSAPVLQTITKSYTPTESVQSETITASAGYDGIEEVDVAVSAISSTYVGSGITQRSSSDLTASGATVTAPSGYYASNATKTISSGSATPASSISGTSATVSSPSSNKIKLTQTVSNTPQVSAGYISSGTAGNSSVSLTGACTTKSATTYYASTSDQTIGSGTYITGTQTFKAVSQTNLSAENIKNGTTINISNGNGNLWSVTGTYSGGGGGSSVKTGTGTAAAMDAGILRFYITEEVDPTSFVVTSLNDIATSSPATISTVVYDGTNLFNQSISTTSNANVSYANSGISKSYSDGYLTLTSSTNYFSTEATYKIVYSYDGSSANINTADVQVGSGATSITFTGLEDEPLYWSCVFKSNFSTSSGYQRVICVADDGTNTYGMEMDSSAKYSSAHWTATYNNGSLTITSQGTNAGGYFHQPGYYQLTYVIADASPYEKKSATYRASTSAQTDKIEPSSGYDAMSEVNISIPAVTQTNLTADNIKSGTTVTISNGQSNLWSITGTYGGGGSSKNVQVLQSTSRTNASSLTKVLGDLTVSKTGTYDIYWSGGRSNTSSSYTWGTRLYVDGSGYGTENTSWSNNCQSNHLSNVSLTANQKLSVYARGRTGSYYTFVPMLVIIEV